METFAKYDDRDMRTYKQELMLKAMAGVRLIRRFHVYAILWS